MSEKQEPLGISLELAQRQVGRILNQLQLLQTTLNVVADEAIYLARQLGIQFQQQPFIPQPQPPMQSGQNPEQAASRT